MHTEGTVAHRDNSAALRTRLHGMWSSVADGWRDYADHADRRGAGLTAQMLAATAPKPGERVLELACGAGGVGLAAAALVGPTGEVLISDVVPEMTAVAAARASALGVGAVRTRVLDLEQIDEPEQSFNVVLCREGLMFALDPARATREIHRVLRPGGRTALAVWGPRARNPWLSVLFDTVSDVLGRPIPPPGIPGPFALDDGDRLAALLSAAGFADVVITEVPMPLRDPSFDGWWTRTTALAGPLAAILEALPETVTQLLRARLREAIRRYQNADGLEFPGVSLLATARRD